MRTISRQDELLLRLKQCLGTIQGQKERIDHNKFRSLFPNEKVKSTSFHEDMLRAPMPTVKVEKPEKRQRKRIKPLRSIQNAKEDYRSYKQNHNHKLSIDLKQTYSPPHKAENKALPYSYTSKNRKKFSYFAFQQKQRTEREKGRQAEGKRQRILCENKQNIMQRECKPRERSPSFQYKNNSIQIYKENSPHFPKKYESLDLLNKNKGHHEVPPNYTEILNIKPLFKNISTNAETISKLNKINQLNQRINKRIYNIVNNFGYQN